MVFTEKDEGQNGSLQNGEGCKFLPGNGEQESSSDGKGYGYPQESASEGIRDNKILWRIKNDDVYRKKFAHTLCLCWAFMVFGASYSQFGPSLPDLMLILNEPLERMAWILPAGSVGYMAGSMAAGLAYNKLNTSLMLFVSLVVNSVLHALTPWCSYFPLMIVVRVLAGGTAGVIDTGANANIVSIWHEEGGPYIQAMHLSLAIGAMLGPLYTEPFFAVTLAESEVNTTTEPTTQTVLWTTTDMGNGMNNTDTVTSDQCSGQSACQSRIQFAFLITGILGLSSAVPFLMIFRQRSQTKDSSSNETSTSKRKRELNPGAKKYVLVLVFCLFFFEVAVEDTYNNFLATFLLEHFNWSKKTGSMAMSMYFMEFSIARFFAIFLNLRFKTVNLLLVFSITGLISFLGFLVASVWEIIPLLWSAMVLIGISMSFLFPAIFSWTEEELIPVTGKVTSMILWSAGTTCIVNPIILGYLMDNYTPLWYSYLLFGDIFVYFLLLLVTLMASKYCTTKMKNSLDMEIEIKDMVS